MDDSLDCLQHFESALCEDAHMKAANDVENRDFVMWVILEYQNTYRIIMHHPERKEELESKYKAFEQVIRQYVLGLDINKACIENGV